MTVGTEITFAGIVQLFVTAGGIVYAWADARGRIGALERRLEKAEAGARIADARILAQQEAFALYRERQAREVVSREILREVEARITSEIRDLRGLFAEAISDRK